MIRRPAPILLIATHAAALAVKFRTCLFAIAVLAGSSGESRAAIIAGSLPEGATILQLPDQNQSTIPFQQPIRGYDPRVGGFRFDSSNRLISRSDTDTIRGLTDFEEISFLLDQPIAPLTGLAFTFITFPLSDPDDVILLDQDNNRYRFQYPQAGTKFVSFVATEGDTIRGFSISTGNFLRNPVGPFLVSTAPVPEPSTLALGMSGAALAGLGWTRRRKA